MEPQEPSRTQNGGESIKRYTSHVREAQCSPNCPNLLRIAQLQNQLEYYKSRCEVYESRFNMVNHSTIRMSIQRCEGEDQPRTADELQKVEITRGSKDKLMEFSRKIDQRMKETERRKAVKTSIVKSVGSESLIADLIPEKENTSPLKTQNPCEEMMGTFVSRLMTNQPDEEFVVKINSPRVIQRLISDLCIFGLKSNTIASISKDPQMEINPQLVYSMYNLFEEPYNQMTASYLFPLGLNLKKIRREKRQPQLQQIILQTPKKQSNFIYALKADSVDFSKLSKQQADLLNQVNPERKLFYISLMLNQFTMVQKDEEKPQSQETDKKEQKKQQQIQKKSPGKPVKQMYTSKRVISILTFYPFFEFFESVLITLLNELKLERMNIFERNIEKAPQIDSQFIERRFSDSVYRNVIQSLNKAEMVYNLRYLFELAGGQLVLNTTRSQIPSVTLGGWVFAILRMFSKDTFYQTLCAILFEEQVVFVSENLHMLTYTIYLFSEILFRPFSYPHASVYIVTEESFLDAPTPIILGVNGSLKWLEETIHPDKETRTFIYLAEEVMIKDNKKRPRSEKLRKLVRQFYKPYDKGITFFEKKKKDLEYCYNATKQQKEASLQFINEINYFFDQELARDVPDRDTVQVIRNRVKGRALTEKQDEALMMTEEIQKEIIRGKKERDPFVEKFLKSLVFERYFFEKIGFQ